MDIVTDIKNRDRNIKELNGAIEPGLIKEMQCLISLENSTAGKR